MDLSPVGVPLLLSLQLAILTTIILLVIGLPISVWLASGQGIFRGLVETTLTLPLVLPPTVLGYYLLVTMGPRGWLGRGWEALFGTRLPFTFAGILIASVVANLPFAIRPFTSALRGIDGRYREAAWCLGVSRWRTFLRITLPLARSGIATGLILTFAHAIGEFGVILMVGGNIPGVTRTLSLAIYDDMQSLNYAAANQSGIILMLMALVAVFLTRRLERNVAR